MKMVNGMYYKKIGLILISFILIFSCSCSATDETQEYLKEKYNDTFIELGHKNFSTYKEYWFESKTYPELYIKVEKDESNYFDDYNMRLIEYNFSKELTNIVNNYIDSCYIYTVSSRHGILDSNTEYKDIVDLTSDNTEYEPIGVFSTIFIEESNYTDESIYKIAQEIRNKYSNIRGTYRFEVIKDNSTKEIKNNIKKYMTLNSSDYYEDVIKESVNISFSPTLKLPSWYVYDDYSFPTELEFWEK